VFAHHTVEKEGTGVLLVGETPAKMECLGGERETKNYGEDKSIQEIRRRVTAKKTRVLKRVVVFPGRGDAHWGRRHKGQKIFP